MKPLSHSNASHRIKKVVGLNEAVQDRTDYLRLDRMQEEEINYSDMPETNAAFWQNAQVTDPGPKKAISLRVDTEVLRWFKARGGRYQRLMNEVLRHYMQGHR